MTEIKVWIDDIRVPPGDGWIWFKSSAEALAWAKERHAAGKSLGDMMSFDHDLGGDDTTRPLVMWMCENNVFPSSALVHSSNPPGALWIMQMFERYAPVETSVHRVYYAPHN